MEELVSNAQKVERVEVVGDGGWRREGCWGDCAGDVRYLFEHTLNVLLAVVINEGCSIEG